MCLNYTPFLVLRYNCILVWELGRFPKSHTTCTTGIVPVVFPIWFSLVFSVPLRSLLPPASWSVHPWPAWHLEAESISLWTTCWSLAACHLSICFLQFDRPFHPAPPSLNNDCTICKCIHWISLDPMNPRWSNRIGSFCHIGASPWHVKKNQSPHLCQLIVRVEDWIDDRIWVKCRKSMSRPWPSQSASLFLLFGGEHTSFRRCFYLLTLLIFVFFPGKYHHDIVLFNSRLPVALWKASFYCVQR